MVDFSLITLKNGRHTMQCLGMCNMYVKLCEYKIHGGRWREMEGVWREYGDQIGTTKRERERKSDGGVRRWMMDARMDAWLVSIRHLNFA